LARHHRKDKSHAIYNDLCSHTKMVRFPSELGIIPSWRAVNDIFDGVALLPGARAAADAHSVPQIRAGGGNGHDSVQTEEGQRRERVNARMVRHPHAITPRGAPRPWP
jgi:hypothetical protein